MKQRAHAWLALRALKFIDDTDAAPELVNMLFFYLSDIWDGAWLPDTLIRDMSYGHIFKMDSDPVLLGQDISGDTWLVTGYPELRSKLGTKRMCLELVKDSPELSKPYRSHANLGGDLPNRVLAVSHSISDMLKMADYPLAFYAKKQVPDEYKADLSSKSVKDLSGSPNFSARQIAITFFIISHYIADAHMPLHCDLRDYGAVGSPTRRVPPTLHASIEEEWEKQCPEKDVLMMNKYSTQSLDQACLALPAGSMLRIDSGSMLGDSINNISQDEWQEAVYICRVSYALSRAWLDGQYKDAKELIAAKGAADFATKTNAIFHDAVMAIAAYWLKAWKKFTE